MKEFMLSLLGRFKALGDKSALLLIVPFVVALFLIDTPMAETLIQWLIFAPVLAGVAIIVSRITFPQIDLSALVEEARKGNIAAGLVSGCLVIFVGILLLALVTWTRA